MSFVTVATIDELGTEPLAISVESADDVIDVSLVRVDDEIFAIKDECSHGHVKLSEGDVDHQKCAIECWLHGSCFDLRTGAALNLPATQPVPVYPVRIEGDEIAVDVDSPLTQENN